MKKNLFALIIAIIIFSLGTYFVVHHVNKPESPFTKYAAIIPGTYRLGFTNLNNELQDRTLSAQGTIPEWISGTLYRNGPAQFYTDSSWVSNWFDGLAMIHAFNISNGQVSYSNKFLHGTDYQRVKRTGKMNYAGFMQDPCGSLFKHLFSWFVSGDIEQFPALPNANVNIVQYTDHLAALTEIPLPVKFDPQTLETVGVIDYADDLPKRDIHDTAHPHYDPVKKEHLGYFTQFGQTSTVNLYAISDGTTTRRIIGSYDVQEPSYMHSFAITKQYALFTALPLVVNPLDLLSGTSFINSFHWKPELGTDLIVINRDTGLVVGKYPTIPFFAFHTVNAYEMENSIILDVVIYKDPAILDQALLDHLLAPQQPQVSYSTLHRFIIDITTGNVSDHTISSEHIELPRINYAYNGKKYTYVYALGESAQNSFKTDKLVKLNVNTGQKLIWQQPSCFPEEPVFITQPDAQQEDAGVVLSVVLDTATNRSFLLILNAHDFTEIARAYVPHHIPFGIHGLYVPH